MRLAVVVVTHNSAATIDRCLHGVLSAPSVVAVEVVDNGSTDGTPEILTRRATSHRDARLRIMINAGNPGFGAASNAGLRRVPEAEAVLFLNPDALVSAETLEEALDELFRSPAVGMLGVRLVRQDGSLDPACLRNEPSVIGALTYLTRLERLGVRAPVPYHPAAEDYLRRRDADAVSGAFMLCRREALLAAGSFDERFWMYGEDLDLCRRIRAAGWRIVYDGALQAVHVKGASTAAGRPFRVDLEFCRSTYRYYTKWSGRGVLSGLARPALVAALAAQLAARRAAATRHRLGQARAGAAMPVPVVPVGHPGTAGRRR